MAPEPKSSATAPDEALVSVIVPAFNAARYIGETCRSVLNQTYRSLELIVVDDGSTDGTAGLVEEFARADSRVRLVQQRNLGVAAARNRAIADARGEFVAPLDADDIWDPTKIERQVRRLQECGPETGLIYCWWVWINATGAVLDRSPPWEVEGRALQRMIEVNFTGNASVPLIRRSVFDRLGGYDPGLRAAGCEGCEDYDVVLRIAEHYDVAVVPAVLVGYRRLDDGMSADSTRMSRSRAAVMAALATRCPTVPVEVFRYAESQFALYLAGISFWSGDYVRAIRWTLQVRPPTIFLPVLPYILRVFARRLWRNPVPVARLDGGSRPYEEYDLPAPLIPYHTILGRRWGLHRRDGPAVPRGSTA